jgi:hypothetical protein
MKKHIFFSITLLFSIISFATEAPKLVKEAFAKKFPSVTSIKWEKENAKEYEASFKLDKMNYSANFSIDGTWLETESEIKTAELPVEIIATIKQKYSNWKIVSASKIEHVKNGIQYEADLQNGKIKKEVIFSSKGVIIK